MGDRGRNHYNGSRKRERAPSEDGDERRPNRRRFEETPLPKLRRELLNIGDVRVYDNATFIAEGLDENHDDEYLRRELFDIFIQLIIEQPFKVPYVALVAIYSNSINTEVTTEAIKHVTNRAQDALNAGLWTEFKLMLRCLACMQSVFEGNGVFDFLEQLFDTVVDLQSANENDVVGIELVKIILLTIPYAVASGGTVSSNEADPDSPRTARFADQAKQLLEKTGIVASNMLPMEGLIHTYAADTDPNREDIPMAYHSVIGLLQSQLMNEAESGWKLAFMPPFFPIDPKRAKIDAPQSHTFPTFAVPSPVNPGPNPLFPEAYFSLYTGQEIVTVPQINNIASSLIRDSIVDTINQLDFNREGAARFLIEVDQYWASKTFATRGMSFDTFKEKVTAGENIWKSEDVIIEAIFSQLFKLPTPQHKLVYYHSLITQCCKLAPAAIAPSLGRVIRTIYRNLDIMDLELAYRFLDWFSHHLSNFEFRWRWDEWVEDLSLSDLHPKKAFILSALDKEMRLSFSKRIRATLPEKMHEYVPERLDKDESPHFKYEDATTPFATEGQALLLLFRKKGTPEQFEEAVKKIQELAVEQDVADPLIPCADALVTAICRAGAKSSSHVLNCIEKGKDQLLSIANNSEPARRQIVASVVEYWKDQSGNAVRIIDNLLNYAILTPMSIVQWALGDYLGAGEALAKAWVFEMVSNTVTKVTKRNRQILGHLLQKGLPQDAVDTVQATLLKERESARGLFRYIEDTLRGVAQGGDILLEKESNGEISQEDGQLIRAWARRWHTVFIRKAQVEESVVGEEAVEAKLKLLAAEVANEPAEAMDEDVKPEAVAEQAANGAQDDEML